MKQVLNLIYNEKLNLGLDLYLPDSDGFKTIVFIHGGGLKEGDKRQNNYLDFAEDFTEKGYAFASINYRLYPDAKYPDYIIDCANALWFLNKKIRNYGGNGDLIVSGQSAGAYMALMLCFNPIYLNEFNMSPLDIKSWIIDSASAFTHFNVIEHEYNKDPMSQIIDERAPVYYVNSSLKFSRILLMVYENDMPMRRQQNELLYENIRYFKKDADIELKVLKGSHCHGSIEKNADGSYDYVKNTLDFLQK